MAELTENVQLASETAAFLTSGGAILCDFEASRYNSAANQLGFHSYCGAFRFNHEQRTSRTDSFEPNGLGLILPRLGLGQLNDIEVGAGWVRHIGEVTSAEGFGLGNDDRGARIARLLD